MKIAIIILLIIGCFDWTINNVKHPEIRFFINLATLICFIIYSH